MDIGRFVRLHRKRLNLSQEKLASACGTNPALISRIEQGEVRRGIEPQMAQTLATALETRYHYLRAIEAGLSGEDLLAAFISQGLSELDKPLAQLRPGEITNIVNTEVRKLRPDTFLLSLTRFEDDGEQLLMRMYPCDENGLRPIIVHGFPTGTLDPNRNLEQVSTAVQETWSKFYNLWEGPGANEQTIINEFFEWIVAIRNGKELCRNDMLQVEKLRSSATCVTYPHTPPMHHRNRAIFVLDVQFDGRLQDPPPLFNATMNVLANFLELLDQMSRFSTAQTPPFQ